MSQTPIVTVPLVTVDRHDDFIRIVKLNRPQKLNAMNAALMSAIADTMEALRQDNQCRVVILTGEGRGFCSGLDLDDSGIVPNIDNLTVPRIAMRAIEHFAAVVPAMRRVRVPIIAAINGPAYGGGMCLTLGADIRICNESAVFNATGINNGLTSTELGSSWLLPRLIGFSRSNEIMLTGRNVHAEEAERIGLVSKVLPDDQLLEEALRIAGKIAKLSPHGVAMTKETLWASMEIPGLEASLGLENRNQILLGMTTNLEEAIKARKEKREPVYKDKPINWPQDW
jgi:enoyl-CoA hydratase